MGKGKKSNLIIKTWERCKSLGRGNGGRVPALYKKSKSWPSIEVSLEAEEKHRTRKNRVAPEGCFTVYVGPHKQRFVIKTEYANHPLFMILLEEAESEYGFNSEGPLVLPCNVDFQPWMMATNKI
ncbi:SMALL AUXIN UPREGULATED RNA 55 [Hibiscus trionum]|uniref:SMALL AUXIN UPREGULATED RNA 55 n=1 Tax=Hibiscus trionum TaxID=183268 RepID=A0A9W7MPD0_HIBTR|nr:SMALL AUXIN UPREGULATED RNA 55 [Hibiscus trionum]